MDEKIHPITLFDSYLKKEIIINPDDTIEKGKIKMYSCGPTVYSTQQIGNMKAAWFPDTLRKIAEYAGWEVQFVHNITDVGHLTGDNFGDADSGEDRLEKGAKREGKTVQEIVDFYLNDYLKQSELLGVDIPTGKYRPKATEYIKEQMVLALTLLKNGKAYLTEDGIYLDSQVDNSSTSHELDYPRSLRDHPLDRGTRESIITGELPPVLRTTPSTGGLVELKKSTYLGSTAKGGEGNSKSATLESINNFGYFKKNVKLVERAKEMSKNMTQSEKRIWFEILDKQKTGYKFIKQYIIFNYILDFYCSELLLAVEIDGNSHDNKIEYDIERDKFLISLNIKVLRYTNDQILNNLENVFLDLQNQIKQRKVELEKPPSLYQRAVHQVIEGNSQSPYQGGAEQSEAGVISPEIQTILQKIQDLKSKNPEKPIVVAIDGRGGSGKSTLAEKLSEMIPQSHALRLDEFYLPQSEIIDKNKLNYDIERLIIEVLNPLEQDKPIAYGQYNWGFYAGKQDEITPVKISSNIKVLIIEGCSSTQEKLSKFIDLKIFINTSAEISYYRGKQRDIKEYQLSKDKVDEVWSNWKIAEQEYLESWQPQAKADLIISTENDRYEIVADFTEFLPQVKEISWKVPLWWHSKFPNEKLEDWKILDGGVVSNTILINNKLVLKVLTQKYSWSTSSEIEYQDILNNYKLIQKDFKFDFIPEILEIEDKNNIFEVLTILMEYEPFDSTFETYYKLSDNQKLETIETTAKIIKNFHNQTLQKNQSFNTQNLLSFALKSFEEHKDKISEKYKNIIQNTLQEYKIRDTAEDLTHIHGDIHFGNLLFENTKKFYLIDFDWLDLQPRWVELRGLFQGFLLAECTVRKDLEVYYKTPIYKELIAIIKLYHELFPKDRIKEIELLFIDVLMDKLAHPKFNTITEIMFDLVFEKNLFELLADGEYEKATELFQQEFGKNLELQDKHTSLYQGGTEQSEPRVISPAVQTIVQKIQKIIEFKDNYPSPYQGGAEQSEAGVTPPVIIAIDGRGGSGKSTLAKKLAKIIPNSVFIEQDKHLEFMKGMDTTAETWDAKNFDLDKQALNEELQKSEGKNVIILEGIKSFENLDSDLKIWLASNSNTTSKRAENRDVQGSVNPIGFKKFWQEFERHSQKYIEGFNPQAKADLIISTENTGYEIVENKTEWTDFAKNIYNLVPIWWESKFPNEKLESFQFTNNGVGLTLVLNNKYLLKILEPRFAWDKRDENRYKKAFENYELIKKLRLQFTPEILEVEFSDILKANYVLMDLIQGKDLFEVYYTLDQNQKLKVLTEFIEIIKSFHKTGLAHGDLHFGNILFENDTQKLWLIDFEHSSTGLPVDEMYGIIQGFLLPSCCVSKEIENVYQQPLYTEFIEIIKQYPELLPKAKLDEAKKSFHECFDEKQTRPKFKNLLEPIYNLVLEKNLFELLADGEYEKATELFEQEYSKNLNLPTSQKIIEGNNLQNSTQDMPLSRGSHEVGGILPSYTGRDIVQTQKRHPEDFAVWKFVTEDNLQKWKFEDVAEGLKLINQYFTNKLQERQQSPYQGGDHEVIGGNPHYQAGVISPDLLHKWGTPGWHSECVAMIASILGNDKIDPLDEYKNITGSTEKPYLIDIHSGGEEHIPIHHQDEILQSEALGFHLSRHWIHWKHVLIDGGKMGKSLGNAYTVHDIINKGFDPLAYRLLLMEHHYGEYMNFTWDKLEQSQNRLYNLRKEAAKIRSFGQDPTLEQYDETKYEIVKNSWLDILTSNLDIPKFLDQYQEYLLYVSNRIQKDQILAVHDHKLLSEIESILKLKLFEVNLPSEILILAENRWEVKKSKDFTTADRIRKEVLEAGWQIDDYSWGWGIWPQR